VPRLEADATAAALLGFIGRVGFALVVGRGVAAAGAGEEVVAVGERGVGQVARHRVEDARADRDVVEAEVVTVQQVVGGDVGEDGVVPAGAGSGGAFFGDEPDG